MYSVWTKCCYLLLFIRMLYNEMLIILEEMCFFRGNFVIEVEKKKLHAELCDESCI